VTVIATSNADPTKSGTATISLWACSISSYAHARAIIIDHTKVPNTDQTNFPLLISGTYTYLATAANGGGVQNPSGYDIIFTSDLAGANQLNYEIDSYDAATGNISAWVQIPNLSHTVDTVIYVNYGNSSITASQATPTGVWDSTYEGVWHFSSNGYWLVANDSTSNGNSVSLPTYTYFAATGFIGAAASFGEGYYNGSSLYFPASSSMENWTAETISFWMMASPLAGPQTNGNVVSKGALDLRLLNAATNSLAFGLSQETGVASVQSPGAVADNMWHKVDATITSGGYISLFVDGVYNSGAQEISPPSNINEEIVVGDTYMSTYTPPGPTWFIEQNLLADELRVSSVARSADWIAAEHSNQTSPGAFYTIYPEAQTGVAVAPGTPVLYGGQTQQFTASSVDACAASFTWTSPSAIGNLNPSTGLYSAPANITTQQTITITATNQADSTQIGSATVTLMPPVSVTVTAPSIGGVPAPVPSPYYVYPGATISFTAVVANTTNTNVNWSSVPNGIGNIDPITGIYTAPGTISAPQQVTITATSQADLTKTGSAVITLSPAPVVTISPATSSIVAGQTLQYSATMSNANPITTSWSASPGTISRFGLYSAPIDITTATSVTVTAIVSDGVNSPVTGTATSTITPAMNSAFGYRRAIVIDHTKVPNTDQANFPVLISGTYGYLANVANGGHVQNANGYDIIFSSDCTGNQKLDHEIESYNPATGAVAMWVRLANVSHTTDTVFYVSYGDSTIQTSQENRTGVWDSSYEMVLHLAEAAAPYNDSTANAYVSGGGTPPTPVAGKIGGAQSFDGVSQYISYSQAQSPNPASSISMEAWIKTSATTRKGIYGKWASDGTANSDEAYELLYGAGGLPGGLVNALDGTNAEVDATAPINDGNWHHLAVTAPASGSISVYVDGAPAGSINNSHALLMSAPDRLLVGATSLAAGPSFMQGSLDEVRISNAVRSADWISTGFANQDSPATFYSILPENASGVTPVSATLTSSQPQQFTAVFNTGTPVSATNPLVLLGTVTTPSPAGSIAIDGNVAYVCDTNEISVVDISDPANPSLLGFAPGGSIQNDGFDYCSIQGNSLLAFVDATNTGIGNNPSFIAFNVQNPTLPTLIQATSLSTGERFYSDMPVYVGNIAYESTYIYYGSGDQGGDLFALETTNLASPTLVGSMESPSSPSDGPNPVLGIALANNQTLYAGSTVTGDKIGTLIVADISTPPAINTTYTLLVPNTANIYHPVIQGNLAVALGDNGTFTLSGGIWQGNIVVTTFDISNVQRPTVIASVVTPYKTAGNASGVSIGPNLFLFGSVPDSAGNNVLLLVDTTDPARPAITPFPVSSWISRMVVAGNILHTAGSAGYADYQIPSVGQAQAFATQSCGQPVSWTPLAPGLGNTTSAGLYTAPANVTGEQVVTVTAFNPNDPSQTISAEVTLLAPVLETTLSAVSPGPFIAGSSATFQATVTGQNGVAMPGIALTLAVSGVNSQIATATTDSNGHATFTYTGAHRGMDSLRATPSINGSSGSSLLQVYWIQPANPMTTTPVSAQFFASCPSGCQAFTTPAGAQPVFTQVFPGLLFDPFAGMVSPNSTGVTSTTVPVADIVVSPSGLAMGTIVAQSGLNQAGAGSLQGFSAVYRGSFVVTQAGTYTFNVGSANGFIFGVSNGAQAGSGNIMVNRPASGTTVFSQYPVMGVNNGPSTNAPTPIAVTFPAAGTHPYEIDYQGGLTLAVTLTQGSTTLGLLPLTSLTLTSNASASQSAGTQASFTVQATDETGAPIAQLPVTVGVSGANPEITLFATTDSTGAATVKYTGGLAGIDLVQASATVDGMATVSNQASITWTASQTNQPPEISVSANTSVTLPNPLSLTATVTDPDAPLGGAISVNWAQVSGPGTVTFSAQQPVTSATFSAAGSYMLQITATDSLGSVTMPVGPITVNVPNMPSQGWIGTPLNHTAVSGVVPVTVSPGVTLQSGTLSYYSISNPDAVTVIQSNTAGTGTIGTFDTTQLRNGTYYLWLNATDSTGNTMSSAVMVTVSGNYKPGRVTATVTDLVVPAAGLAIKIQRIYDTLNANNSSDFGYGWSLGTRIDLEVNGYGDVTFTWGNQRRTFYFTPRPLITVVNSGLYEAEYTPEPGLHGTLVTTSDSCSGNPFSQGPAGSSCWLIDGNNGAPMQYQAFTYLYTDPAGTQYSIGADGTLQSVVDLNGNKLTITAAGITSTTGLSVPFQRDAQGRITQITDTANNNYLYTYDTSGNLSSVTYPGIATPAKFQYSTGHLLTEEWDRNGNVAGTSIYDPVTGRLSSITDEMGNQTQFAYNTSTNTTTITNPDGGHVVTVSDANGNPLSVTDPLNRTTTYTYDANQNLLTKTDPLGDTWSYTYDGNGNQTSATDPLGNTSTEVYNQYGGPVTITDAVGNVQNIAYDANFNPATTTDSIGQAGAATFDSSGNIHTVTNANGKTSTMTYDSQGNVSGVLDPLGYTAGATYDTLGGRLTSTDANQYTTHYKYDGAERLTTTTFADNSTSGVQYDNNGNVTTRTDALNQSTTYTYWPANWLKSTSFPDGTSTSVTYNWRGQPVTQTDQNGYVTFNAYDLAGQLTSTTTAYQLADAATTNFSYDAAGRRTTTTDPKGNATESIYDSAGRLAATINALNQVTAYTLDADGRQTAVTDALGRTTQYTYDARGRVTQVTYPDGTTTSSLYDGVGHVTASTDQAGMVTKFGFDDSGRMKSVTDALNQITQYSYDPNGNRQTRTDANNHVTAWTYDVMNRVWTRTLPGGGATETYTYNPTGTVFTVKDFNGKTTTFAYDHLNRLTTRTPDAWFAETAVNFTYTPTGQRLKMTDGSGATSYTYDDHDRLQTKTTPAGTLTYGYDLNGNLQSLASSNTNGANAFYTYDQVNRLTSVNNSTYNYNYDAVGNVTSESGYWSPVTLTSTYDQMNRVTALQSTSNPTTTFSYAYGKTGNRLMASDRNGSSNYTYDSIYRMTEEAISRSEAKGTLTYGLDPVGNRQSLASTVTGISQQSASYNVNDQVLANTYDANGNTLGANGNSYGYDSMDRMTSFNNGSVKMVYDGDGNRVKKISGGVTTQYLVDELNPTGLPQVMDEVVKSGVAQRTYLYGLRRISQTQVASGTTSYYGYDAHGDVRSLMNNGGVVTDTYDYDAFGNVVGSTGTTPNVYRYQGEALDSETGLYYLRARYYDPTVGRFLNVDPMADQGEHPYEYADADPVDGHDPTGEQDVIETSLLMWLMPPMPQISGIKLSVKCLASMTLSVLSIPGQWMHAVTACQATPVGGRTGSGRGHGPASPPTKPPDCQHCFDTNAFAQKIDSLTAGNGPGTTGYPGHKNAPGTWCAWYVHAALVAGGANVPSGNAFTFAASLPGSGFEQVASYPAPIRSMAGIPGSQQGDITVFGKTSTHQSGHIEGFDGVHWTSYWQQKEGWYPYSLRADTKGPAGPALVFRTKCPCGN
jgi:RHS repeat-associated protein